MHNEAFDKKRQEYEGLVERDEMSRADIPRGVHVMTTQTRFDVRQALTNAQEAEWEQLGLSVDYMNALKDYPLQQRLVMHLARNGERMTEFQLAQKLNHVAVPTGDQIGEVHVNMVVAMLRSNKENKGPQFNPHFTSAEKSYVITRGSKVLV